MNIHFRYFVFQGLNWGSVGILLPVLTLMCLSLGINLMQLGLLYAVFSITNVLLEVPSGALADKYGRFRIFYIARWIDVLGCVVVLIWPNVYGMAGSFIAAGIARALSSGTVDAWYMQTVSDSDEKDRLSHFVGMTATVTIASLAIGSLIGGQIPKILGPIITPELPYLATMWVLLICYLFILAITKLLLPEGKDVRQSNSAGHILKEAFTKIFSQKAILVLLFLQILVGFCMAQVENYWQPIIETISKYGVGFIGVLTALYFVFGSLGSLTCGWLYKRLGHKMAVFFMIGLTLIFVVAMSQTTELVSFSICLLGFAFCLFTCGPLITTAINEDLDESVRSTVNSIFALVFHGGAALSAFLMGLLAKNIGIQHAWFWLALLGFGMLLATLMVGMVQKRVVQKVN